MTSARRTASRSGDLPQPDLGEAVETRRHRTSEIVVVFSSRSLQEVLETGRSAGDQSSRRKKIKNIFHFAFRPIYNRKSRRTSCGFSLLASFFSFCTQVVRGALIGRRKSLLRRDWFARPVCIACAHFTVH